MGATLPVAMRELGSNDGLPIPARTVPPKIPDIEAR
jgi:hypothetical protein